MPAVIAGTWYARRRWGRQGLLTSTPVQTSIIFLAGRRQLSVLLCLMQGLTGGGLAQTPYSLDQHQSAHAVGRQLHRKSIADGSHRLVLYPQTLRVLKIVAGEG
jgi:hypothetical protein